MKKWFANSARDASALLDRMEAAQAGDASGAMAAMGQLVAGHGLHPQTLPFVLKTLDALRSDPALLRAKTSSIFDHAPLSSLPGG